MDVEKLNILIVDDEPINIHTVVSLLHDNYNLSIAKSGIMALEIIDKNRPDIILLDVNMPQMNGFEVAREVYKNEANKEIPVIFFSVDSSIDYIEKGFDLGAVDYIVKPIEPKSFTLKIALWAKLVRKTKENQEKQLLLDQYKTTVDRSAMVSKTDKTGVIIYVNEKFCEITGYTKEELLGQKHSLIRHPDMPSSTFKELWETIESGKPWSGIIKNRTKDEHSFYGDTLINPLVNSSGNIVEYIAVRHDITELEKYKNLLKDELSTTNKSLEEYVNYMQQYEEAINSLTAIIKTDTNSMITYVNSKFTELMGYDTKELLGFPCSKFRDEKHTLKHECESIKNELNNKKLVKKMLTNITKSGKNLHTVTLFYPILDLNSNVIEHLQVIHDVTEIINLNEEIIGTQKEVVLTMGAIGETRSKETGLHVKRVAEYSYLLARLTGLSEERANLLKQASPMHDIGKVGIPDDILNKPGALTENEFEIMKTHAELGYEMLKHSKRDILKTAATIAYSHHEKYDGSGYPNKLKGKNIPIEGRITAIADVFDALGHDRVYKKAWKTDAILKLFRDERGKHFDPEIVDLFFENLNDFLKIQIDMQDVA